MRRKILDQNGLNFLTFTIVEWIDLFSRPVYKDIIIDSLAFCQKNKGLNVHAYVIMSNHVHVIFSTEASIGLSSIIQHFKSFTAKQILNYINDKRNIESRRTWLLNHFAFNARKNNKKSKNQVWQSNNHPVMLYSPKAIRVNLLYIHNNPVVAKIVKEQEDYIYSSASNYMNGKGILEVQILDDIWNDAGYISF